MEIIRRSAPRRVLDLTVPIEPVEYKFKPITKRIVIFDSETDPFDKKRIVKPFTCGLWFTDTEEYFDFWGDDCMSQMIEFLTSNYAEEELLILAHNGGNFDFYFLTEWFDVGHKPFIINGRLVRLMIAGQEWRDSYAMMPIALGAYDKIKFDYDLMEKWEVCSLDGRETTVRELYKPEILHYQKRDCTSLGELVLRWYSEFGDRLTIASASLARLRSFQGFETLSPHIDKEMRPYYFGGRNQCFATGVMRGNFRVYDINSSYPNVMANVKHPISDTPKYEAKITSRTHFAKIRAWSLGALPVRKPDGGLDFPVGTGDFFACIHEINAGLETKTLRIHHVYHSIYFESEASFAPFVNAGFARRQKYKSIGDGAGDIIEKLKLNSPYGKFAQDPEKYENWLFDPIDVPQPQLCESCNKKIKKGEYRDDCELCRGDKFSPYGWYLHTKRGEQCIFAQPNKVQASSYFNVATAASITSAARANLLRGIRAAVRPLYTDTDSVICEVLEGEGIEIDPKKLGAWDIEAEGDVVCIAGKKLYAIFTSDPEKAKPGSVPIRTNSQGILYEVKKASKGVKLTADEIRRVCEGEVIEYESPVPKFQLNGDVDFITRNIKRTG